jgi:hypothetical protein
VPKRSNDWQAIVFLVKRHLAPEAMVTESAMLKDRETGSEVEVDVCIQGTIGASNIVISVECRDAARPSGVGWVNEMHSKHASLPTNVLILASRRRFTRDALRRAAARNIRTFVLGKPTGAFNRELEKQLRRLWAKRSHFAPSIVKIHLAAAGDVGAVVVPAFPDNLVFVDGEVSPTTAKEVVHAALTTGDPFNLRDRGPTEEDTVVRFVPGKGSGAQRLLFLRHEQTGTLQPITQFEVHGALRVSVSEVPLSHGQVEQAQVAWGRATFGEEAFLITSIATEDGHRTSDIRPVK